MNSGADCLEPRMEVQFYDKYDLLGQGNDDPKNNEKGEILNILLKSRSQWKIASLLTIMNRHTNIEKNLRWMPIQSIKIYSTWIFYIWKWSKTR